MTKKCVKAAVGLTVGKEYEILAEGHFWYLVKDDNKLKVKFSKEDFE